MSGAYRIEISKQSRAGCKATECKREGVKIQKGELRYGVFVTSSEFQSWSWKHWGCVTPKQISNLKKDIEDDVSNLDGYDELPKDFQVKAANAIEEGHVDDEDWRWDVEMNREGKNGYLTVESKRRLKAEDQALKEAAGEGSASPSKTENKKRGHFKDELDAEGPAEDEPPAKKTKAKAKKEPKIKSEDPVGEHENEGPKIKETKSRIKKEPKIKKENADGGSENEDPKPKKAKAVIKKEPEIKSEDVDGGSENEGPKTKKIRSRIKKEPNIKEDAEAESENQGPANKETKAAIKKVKKGDEYEADGAFEQDTQRVKKGRKKAKKATAGDEGALHIKDESSDHDALPPPMAKKTRVPRKTAIAKKIKDEDTESEDVDPASALETPLGNVKLKHTSEPEAEAGEDGPKFRKGPKKAPKKAVNGTAEATKKEVKPTSIPAAPRSNGRVTRSRPSQASLVHQRSL